MSASPDIDLLFEGLIRQDRGSLARAITLTESRRPQDDMLRRDLLDRCVQYLAVGNKPPADRWAVTGPPGVGKSSLIDRLGMTLIEEGRRVAVLAVDPSSEVTGGSILGDKTRMERLSRQEAAFIRPSPAGTHLGGVTEATREAALVCEAAGFDTILIETVGVGQSEHAVRHMVDLVLLVTMLGAGDELQGIKRGIMEAADMVVVNKADGEAERPSKRYAVQLEQALELLRGHEKPAVLCTSAVSGTGVSACIEAARGRLADLRERGVLDSLRHEQRSAWFADATRQLLLRRLENQTGFAQERQRLDAAVRSGSISPWTAAQHLLDRLTDDPPAAPDARG
jgi:LAO/AO transport system kinase